MDIPNGNPVQNSLVVKKPLLSPKQKQKSANVQIGENRKTEKHNPRETHKVH